MCGRREQAAAVPTSGATTCGVPTSASAMSWDRNSPIARGARKFSLRSDAPEPGRSTAKGRACPDSGARMGANAYTLSGHGLVNRTVGSCEPPLSAYRTRSPPIVRKPACRVAAVAMQQSFTIGSSFEPANTLARSLVVRPSGAAIPAAAGRDVQPTGTADVVNADVHAGWMSDPSGVSRPRRARAGPQPGRPGRLDVLRSKRSLTGRISGRLRDQPRGAG